MNKGEIYTKENEEIILITNKYKRKKDNDIVVNYITLKKSPYDNFYIEDSYNNKYFVEDSHTASYCVLLSNSIIGNILYGI